MRCELAVPLSIAEIVDYTGAQCVALDKKRIIRGISTDTRELRSSDLFIALNSEQNSGENYISEAVTKGIASLSCSNVNGTLYVSDTAEALLNLATGYLSKLRSLRHVIALTGSVGKTTTKNLLNAMLETSYLTHSTKGNQNNLIGVPLTVLSAPKNTEVLICECGMNRRGEISRLSKCLAPSLSIITNVGTAHIGMLGSKEEILKAKCEIADGMSGGYLLHPLDFDVPKYANTISISDTDENATLRFKVIERDATGTLFSYYGKNLTIDKYRFNLAGGHTFKCLTYAISVADLLGLDADTIKSRVSAMPSSVLRFKEYQFKNLRVIDDSYNASYESIVAALEMMKSCNGSFDVIIGDVLELGDYSEEIHYKIGRAIAKSGAKKAFLVGKYADCVAKGAMSIGMSRENVFIHYETDNLDMLSLDVINRHTKDAPLLIKASRKIRLERILSYFQEVL